MIQLFKMRHLNTQLYDKTNVFALRGHLQLSSEKFGRSPVH